MTTVTLQHSTGVTTDYEIPDLAKLKDTMARALSPKPKRKKRKAPTYITSAIIA